MHLAPARGKRFPPDGPDPAPGSDIRPTSGDARGPERPRADTRRMFHARVLSLAVAPATRAARRPAAAGPRAAARRLSQRLGVRRRAAR